jgi:hypothetical protein
MKTNISLWTRIVLLLILGATATYSLLISCEKEDIQPIRSQTLKNGQSAPNDLMPLPEICGEIEHKDLKASDKTKVGDVYIYNDRNNMYVQVMSLKGTLLKNAYLFVGSMDRIPLTPNMDPDVDRFTYIESSERYDRSRKFIIPLSALDNRFTMSMMVETKAVKPSGGENDASGLSSIDSEKPYYGTAWVEGKPYGEVNSGMFFNYLIERCEIDHSVRRDK